MPTVLTKLIRKMYIDLMKMCLSLRCQGNTDVLDFKWRSSYLKDVGVNRGILRKSNAYTGYS